MRLASKDVQVLSWSCSHVNGALSGTKVAGPSGVGVLVGGMVQVGVRVRVGDEVGSGVLVMVGVTEGDDVRLGVSVGRIVARLVGVSKGDGAKKFR